MYTQVCCSNQELSDKKSFKTIQKPYLQKEKVCSRHLNVRDAVQLEIEFFESRQPVQITWSGQSEISIWVREREMKVKVCCYKEFRVGLDRSTFDLYHFCSWGEKVSVLFNKSQPSQGREVRRYWVKESMPICLEFSTLKSFDNFPNVLSVNALLQWWRRAFTLKTFGKLSKLFRVLNSRHWMGIDSCTQFLLLVTKAQVDGQKTDCVIIHEHGWRKRLQY